MRNKLSIIFLLLGGVFFMVGATFMSLNSEKHEEKKEVPDDTERKIETYMPVIYKIEDNDSFVYIVPDLPLGESRITDIDKRIYDLIDKYRLVVQYNNTKLDQLDYIKNFVLNDEDYLDNYLNDIVRTKLFDFSNAHSKYNYDDYINYYKRMRCR